MDKTLYFFTNTFPYIGGESFIETEIEYLSNEFTNIIIQPLYAYDRKKQRGVPYNCKVLTPIIKNRWQHYLIGLVGFRSVPIYLCDFFKNKVYSNKNWIKQFLIDYCTTNNILQSIKLSKVLKQIKPTDSIYFYWGKGAANLIPFISQLRAKKTVRFHGGDLYDINYGGYIPIQERILKNTDLLVFISSHGLNYLKERHPFIQERSIVSYLGTNDFGEASKSFDGILRILSCSSMIRLKRIDKIYEALQLIGDINIEWTHIGAGDEFENIKEMIKYSNKNVKINLMGSLSNQEVIRYYQDQPLDVFINVSSTEGLPVSIMEAISFNVPVIGTNVGGSSEIVNFETGILLNSNPSIHQIAKAIKELRNRKYEPKAFWKNHFSAKKNYESFIKSLIQN